MKNIFFHIFKETKTICATQKLQFSTKYDLIGPPNPISNLRPIKFAPKEHETDLEKLLRNRREKLQQWNEEFWSKHNTKFMREKEEFIKSEMKKKGITEDGLTADEMSVFYKHFLDKNWENHFQYNLNWYKKNFQITFLDIWTNVQKMFNTVR